MARPSVERQAFFGRPIVPLIHPCDAPATATDEDRFGHFETHPETLQTGGNCPAQIVYGPCGKRRWIFGYCRRDFSAAV